MTLAFDTAAATEVDLIVFEVGDRRLGADASEVLRVGRFDPDLPSTRRLGVAKKLTRALVVRCPRGRYPEIQVPIDRMLAVRRTPVSALRKLPEFARGLAEPAVVGFVADEDGDLMLLIDFEALILQEPLSAALGATGGETTRPAGADRPG